MRTKIPGVLKSVIYPVQAWLLSQDRCVGCGRYLTSGKKSKVTCDCGRIFIRDSKTKKYRRALLEEV